MRKRLAFHVFLMWLAPGFHLLPHFPTLLNFLSSPCRTRLTSSSPLMFNSNGRYHPLILGDCVDWKTRHTSSATLESLRICLTKTETRRVDMTFVNQLLNGRGSSSMNGWEFGCFAARRKDSALVHSTLISSMVQLLNLLNLPPCHITHWLYR